MAVEGPNGDNGRMDIQLNGAPHSLPGACTVAALLEQAGFGDRRVAVEVNGEIVPRGRHGAHALADGSSARFERPR